MSDTFQTGKTFQTGEQVTATDLNNAVNQAVPKVPLTDDQSITVVNNKLTVKDGNATDGVPLTKLKHIIGHSVIGNIGSATAAPTNIEVAANEAVLGNSAGNGLITDKIDTDNIKDDAITQGKTSFIDGNGGMTLSGSSPRVILDDTGNSGTDPYIIADDSGSIGVYSTRANADVIIDGKDEVRIRHDGTNGLTVAADAGKTETGADTPGAKVDGGLYVTGDVYVDDEVVADHLLLQGDNPTITFSDDDSSGKQTPLISANSTNGNLAILTKESESELILECSDNMIFGTTDDPTQDQSGTNDFVERFRVSHDAGKNASGTDTAGAKVTGDLQVTGDINIGGTINEGISIDASAGTTHEILLGETLSILGGEGIDTSISNNTLTVAGENATTSNKGIAKFNSANFSVSSGDVTIKNGGVNNDELANSSLTVTAGTGLSGGGSVALGGSTTINLNSTLPSNQRAVTPSSSDNSTRVATTAFVHNFSNRAFKEITDSGQANITADNQFFDMPYCTIDITANQANRRFLLSGMLGLGARYAGSKFVFKWQYRINNTGSWTDFTMPTNPGNREAGHFEYGNRMDNNTTLVGCLSYKVRTPQLTHSNTDTINFKLVVSNTTSDVDVHINRSTDQADNNDRSRVISQLEVEQL